MISVNELFRSARKYKILFFMCIVPALDSAYGEARQLRTGQIVGEYALTKMSEQRLVEAGLTQKIDEYRTVFVLKSVTGLEIEAQYSQLGGAPLAPSGNDPHMFRCDVIGARITMDIPINQHATGFTVQMKDFHGRYEWIDRGKHGIDHADPVFRRRPPEDLGLNREKLDEAGIKMSSGVMENIHGVLVLKNGAIAFEAYYNGSNANHIHQIRSAGKSITSIAVGIAIDQGLIPGVDKRVFEYFKKQAPIGGWPAEKGQVTIEHLLTMTSGIDCDDWQEPKFACEEKMVTTEDWERFALTLPMAQEPGTHWAYNGTALMILSSAIRKSTGKRYQDFLKDNLLDPLGIKNYILEISPEGNGYTGGSAKMTARDMAKIGYLILKRGNWFGRQVVSSSWVEQSTRSHVETGNHFPYGYLWWQGQRTVNGVDIETCYAAGNGGQYIFIFPALDMVVVFTGGNYNHKLQMQVFGLLSKYFIAAATPQQPAPEIIHIPPTILTAYAGRYKNGDESIVISKDENGLYWVNPTSLKRSRIYPLSEELFLLPSRRYDHLFLKFKSDPSKNITGLVCHNHWRSSFYQKL